MKSGRRYNCKLCWDAGSVCAWSNEAFDFVADNGDLPKTEVLRNRYRHTLRCSCGAGAGMWGSTPTFDENEGMVLWQPTDTGPLRAAVEAGQGRWLRPKREPHAEFADYRGVTQ